MTYKILIVEDDPVIRQQLQLLLAGSGYQVETAGDAAAALARMQTFVPHLVVLDIGLPGASGFELCSQIRAFSQTPIVFVTSSNTDQDELTSILLGGDAFITKPYRPAILLAKIAALLRRAYPDAGEESLCWKGAVLHPESGRLDYQGQTVELTRNEQRILQVLFANKGKVVSRETLMQRLWETDLFVDTNTLTVNMTRLRRKLANLGAAGLIATRKGVGYLAEDI